MKVIKVLDVGIGNFGSIQRIIEISGGSAVKVNDPDSLDFEDKILLPGVGHFKNGMEKLEKSGFKDALKNKASEYKILGICLGMQLLCTHSEEGDVEGLGLVDAKVQKFNISNPSELKIPHMGWNTVRITQANKLLPISNEEQRFYFVHSYKVVPNNKNITIAQCDYGGDFCAAFQQDNIFGVQFHPEKSHRFGMNLIKRFVEI
jgi:glutamine amidotransferase